MNIEGTESYSTNGITSERGLITTDSTTSSQASNRNISQKLREFRLQRTNKYGKTKSTGTCLINPKMQSMNDKISPNACIQNKYEEVYQDTSYPEVKVQIVDPKIIKIEEVVNVSTFESTLDVDDKGMSVITKQYTAKNLVKANSINTASYEAIIKAGITAAETYKEPLNDNQEKIKKEIQVKGNLTILSKSKSLIHVSVFIILKANPPFKVLRMSIKNKVPKALTFEERLREYDRKHLITR